MFAIYKELNIYEDREYLAANGKCLVPDVRDAMLFDDDDNANQYIYRNEIVKNCNYTHIPTMLFLIDADEIDVCDNLEELRNKYHPRMNAYIQFLDDGHIRQIKMTYSKVIADINCL